MSKSRVSSMKSGISAMSISTDHTMSVVNLDTIVGSNPDNCVSAVLIYCKHKVLSPYFRLISFLGWRPLLSSIPNTPPSSPTSANSTSTSSSSSSSASSYPISSAISPENASDQESSSFWTSLIYYLNLIINWLINLVNFIYTLIILILIFSAYFLSYCTCYRGDGLPHLLPLIVYNNQQQPTPAIIDSNNHSLHNNNINNNYNDYNVTSNSLFIDNLNNGESDISMLDNRLATSTAVTPNKTLPPPIEFIRGSSSCNNKLISHFVIPDLLHFASYLYLLYLLRTPECERLENLMERGFLQLSKTTNWFIESRRLIATLRGFLLLSTIWILFTCILHIVHFNFTLVNFNCLPDSLGVNLVLNQNDTLFNNTRNELTEYVNQISPLDYGINGNSGHHQRLNLTIETTLSYYLSPHFSVNHLHKVLIFLTVICLTVFDIICSAVVTNYAVHCQLNILIITSLCQGVREKRITFQEFYQRAEESRKFVSYLNNNQAICVSLVAIVFICKVCLYSFQLFTQISDITSCSLLIISAILWIIILLIPMIQAVRLTQSCLTLRNLGHELKARPFGYQHTDESELNSLLHYTSSLDMTAKLFNLPIKSSSIVLIFSLILIGIPLLGQINVISL